MLTIREADGALTPGEALRELLHDATEFMLGWECIAPLKAQLGEPFRTLDARLQSAIDTRYRLPEWTPEAYAIHKRAAGLAAASEAFHVAGWSRADMRKTLRIAEVPLLDDPLSPCGFAPWEPGPRALPRGCALAEDAHPVARRLGLRPRGADGLVRTEPGRLRVRPGAQPPARRGDRRRTRAGRGGSRRDRQTRPPLQGLPPCDARQLVAQAPGVGKAEWTRGEANPRFIVTSLKQGEINGRFLYEAVYCARGDMENRIKECQGDLFADRSSTATMRANQLRLWLASFAYVLICALGRVGLAHTQFAEATCGTIRLKLLKLAGLVRISARRIKFALASACPYADEWRLAAVRLA